MALFKFLTDCKANKAQSPRRRSVPYLVALALVLLTTIFFIYKLFTNRYETYVCNTKECRDTASEVVKKMNVSVDPCNNFYEFACGTYNDKEIIPEDKTSINPFNVIEDRLLEQLKDIISAEPSENAPKHFRLPNLYYKACINTTWIESLGSTSITKIAKSMGGWPLLEGDKWNENNNFKWQELVKKFRAQGFDFEYIINFSVEADLRNSSKRVMSLDQAVLAVSREYLVKGLNETLVSAYYDYMVDIAVLFGAKKDEAKEQLSQSLQFEIDLATISWPKEKFRNSSVMFNPFTLQQLNAAYPYVDWVDFMNALLPKGLSVQENDIINVNVPPFFEKLGKLLAKTPNRVIANYLMWRIHAFSIRYLSEDFHSRREKYSMTIDGHQKQEERWKECIDIVNKDFDISVGSLYVRKHFDQDSKANVLEMVNNVRKVFYFMLHEVNWMDDKTRHEAKKKLNNMEAHIGYPDEILDDKELVKYYEKLNINPDNFFESRLAINMFETDIIFNLLRLPVNKTDWIFHSRASEVNAYYSSMENSILIPAGIMQDFFFSAQRPNYMNYGTIGSVIGHEITHGFDDEGRQFDGDGDMRDWWQPDTAKAYLKKAQCIIEQYGNFTDRLTGLKLNGINTQGENIADDGGVKEAYRAYQSWVGDHEPEPRLPGLGYTPQQMFWISFAQNACAKDRLKERRETITTDVHSPAEFRVLGPLRNSKDFAKDFQCPEGSPMNPVHKCEVW
ncbi:neprilysin-2-like [Drosophila sulfurigaster albostrigata]|uniref:neprilysin-2-like n=1 Tax=Drosophila sulfurigaster albostrigata TaxID=89887 RepID=UPI002D21B8B4|nr:neprilysin-2-like [Drosophila sulfurigaster albostrigata]